ncbi:lipoprotein signal peptidase [Guyparkeria halophila]|uniref:Lipoprotein signal peptidase n=2 Tax=Thioalkalibacteraceae TaxID=2035710 RepID=A0A6I6CZ55_9GAMM|nr:MULTISPECIES: signal peptidase II [Guyparkeria]QGT79509.1 lipoprotein signal peptidase [Guyparkeria halophila]TKA90005.1 lipoprotein signal peptidase [Guyparkeria sp. SB14A]
MDKANLRWLWLSFGVLVVDQLTKWAALAGLEYARPVEILPFFDFTLLYNTGAAFSFLAEHDGWQRWFFVFLAVVITAVLLGWLAFVAIRDRRIQAGITLVIGGAVGNVIDRVLYGHVVDFLDFHVAGWHWPAFNIADAAITIGVALIIWAELRPVDRESASDE